MLYKYYGRLGWPLVIVLTIIPVLMWIFGMPFEGRFETTELKLAAIGSLTGIVTVMLFCINIILSTRLKELETLFGGLNKMYIAHHLTGGIALCVLLLHPLTLALEKLSISWKDSAIFLLPTTTDWPKTIGTLALWIFVLLMIMTFYVKMPYHLWLLSHKFLGVVLLLISLHVILMPSINQNIILLRIYLLSFLFFAVAAFIYRTLLPRFFVRRYEYTITQVTSPANDVVRIKMQPKNEVLDFKSGQFLFISFKSEGMSHEWHPFTISSNTKLDGIEITVKNLGKYTSTLVKIAPSMIGMDVEIEGAYGRFNFRNFQSRKQVWVAGGIGVTPFLSMLKEIPDDYRVDFYYSVKSEDELIDWQQIILTIQQKTNNNVRVIPIITDKHGFLTAEKILEITPELKECDILLCGPPPMMKALKQQMLKLGVNKSRMHSEEFSMS